MNNWSRWIRSRTLGPWLQKMVSVRRKSVPGKTEGTRSRHHCRKYRQVTAYRGLPVEESIKMKVCPWCGQPSDRGRRKNTTGTAVLSDVCNMARVGLCGFYQYEKQQQKMLNRISASWGPATIWDDMTKKDSAGFMDRKENKWMNS